MCWDWDLGSVRDCQHWVVRSAMRTGWESVAPHPMYFLIRGLYSEIIHLCWEYPGKCQWDNHWRLTIKEVSNPSAILSLITELNSTGYLSSWFRSTSQNHHSSFESYGLLMLGMELWLMITFLYLVVNETNCFKNKQIPLGKEARAEPWKTCLGNLPLGYQYLLGRSPTWVATLDRGYETHTHVGQDDFYRLRAFATKWSTVYFPSAEVKIRPSHIQVWRPMAPTLSIHTTSL